jgi:hypothetical protein
MKQQRSTKPGCFFTGLRVMGFGLIGLGCLMIVGALAGFVRTLVVSWTDLLGIFQAAAHEPMAKLVLTLIFVWLGFFIVLGLLGIFLVAVGVALNFFSTEKKAETDSAAIMSG